MDESIPQGPSKFEQILRYKLMFVGVIGLIFDIWWFLDAQSSNYLNGVLIVMTIVISRFGCRFCGDNCVGRFHQ